MFGGLIGTPNTTEDVGQTTPTNTSAQDATVKHYYDQMAQQMQNGAPTIPLAQQQAPPMATIGQAAPPQALTPFQVNIPAYGQGGLGGLLGAAAS